MKMSVFRQGQGHPELADHIDCMKLAATMEDSDMVLHAKLNDATRLVGLESGQVVIKQAKEGDEALRFEDLYDTAITQHEFGLMRTQKVRSREELAPEYFELRLGIQPSDQPVRLGLRVKAKGQYDVKALVQRLAREDIEFGAEL